MERGKFLSLPNVISMSRLVLAALFVVLPGRGARVTLVVLASLSDMLDGWVARRSRSTSRWGALLDPITDRVFVLVAVATFLFTGMLTTGQYFTLISRDIATAVGFLVARSISWLRPVPFTARYLGKLVTTTQLAALAAVLLYPPAVAPLIVVVGVVSAAAIGDYTLALWRARARSTG